MASVLVESMVGKWRTLPANGVPASSRCRVSSAKASAMGEAVSFMAQSWRFRSRASVFGDDAHAEVDGGSGVSERTGGDEVDARFGVFADGVQLNAAGRFNGQFESARVDELDGRGHLGRRHVVEQDGFRAGFDGLLELLAIAHLHLDALAGLARRERRGEHLGNAAPKRDVVVLDQDAVGEVEAMFFAAAAGDRVFIQQAQAGHGLARVKNLRFGALHLVDVAAGDGGDAAHSLHQVQDYAFAGEQHVRGGAYDGNGLPALDAHAVEDLRMMHDLVAHGIRPTRRLAEAGVNVQKTGNAAQAGDHAIFLGDDGAGGTQLGVDGVGRCYVFQRLVFQQGVFQDGLNSLTLPVHTLSDNTLRRRQTLS